MSVPKPKRKQSQFEVFHNWYKLRRELTDLLLRDFGYSQHKFTKKLNKRFGNVPYEEMSDVDKATFDRYMIRCESFDDWFVVEARTAVMNCLRQVTAHLFAANSIYPTYYEELVARRVHQDEAIGLCFVLKQELQYAIETLPVDIEAYTRFAKSIDFEVALIKGWRKSDNRFKDIIFNPMISEDEKLQLLNKLNEVSSDPASNFANVNNNGNANYNNANNSNGVRLDF